MKIFAGDRILSPAKEFVKVIRNLRRRDFRGHTFLNEITRKKRLERKEYPRRSDEQDVVITSSGIPLSQHLCFSSYFI